MFDFLGDSAKYISEGVGSQKDGAGKFAVGLLGAAIAACFAPIFLGWFILSNGFRVSTKTWFYAIAMVVIAIAFGIAALFQ